MQKKECLYSRAVNKSDMPNALSSNISSVGSLLIKSSDTKNALVKTLTFFSSLELPIQSMRSELKDGTLFARIRWQLDPRWETEDDFCREVRKQLDSSIDHFTVNFSSSSKRVGLIVDSKSYPIASALQNGGLSTENDLEVSFVISAEGAVQAMADRNGLPFYQIDALSNDSRHVLQAEKKQLDVVNIYQPHAIILASETHKLSAHFVHSVGCPILTANSFSYLGSQAVRTTELKNRSDAKMVFASAQFVNAEVAQGEIIEQDSTRIDDLAGDISIESVGQKMEKCVLLSALKLLLENKVVRHKGRAIIID